ncbi:MAG: DUF721 domain-containing protein [Candidatus Contubernalis sp.]|nr:DUF721 domain-containing protein [Candidatus Contubernalis sp.]
MEKLGEALKKTINKMGFAKKIKEEMALSHWEEIAGTQVMEHTRVGEIKGGVLFVYVENSHWSQHLSFFKPSLINKLNHKLGASLVKDIHFKVSSMAESREIEEKEMEILQELPDLKNITLAPEETLKIEEMVEELEDSFFKEKIKNLMIDYVRGSFIKKEQGWRECIHCGVLFNPLGKQQKCPVLQIKK